MSPRLPLAVPLAALALAVGCGETMIAVSSDGQIEIAVSTAGFDVDSDGFSISVDGGTGRFVPAGGTVTLTGLAQGSHTVLLTGVAENCLVEGDTPRSVAVDPDGTARLRFSVRCDRLTTGGFSVVVVTAGEPADPDGYLLAVAGTHPRKIDNDATETFIGLAPGTHLVTLKDVDQGCALAGGNPRPFTVVAGVSSELLLTVNCGSPRPPPP